MTSTMPLAPVEYAIAPEEKVHTPTANSPPTLCSDYSVTSDAPTTPLPRLRLRLFSAFLAYFLCGWGDVTGTVLPYFQAELHLSYMTSSLCFVASTAGFAIGTLAVERTMNLLGRFDATTETRSLLPVMRKTDTHVFAHSLPQARYLALILGSLIHACFFVIMGSDSGFSSILVAYAVAAFARSFLTANLNAYVASTPNRRLGYLLGFWSVGCFAAPLVCQTLMAHGIHWPRFYFGSLVVSALDFSVIVYAFRPTAAEHTRERDAALARFSPPTTPSTCTFTKEMSSSPITISSSDTLVITPRNTLSRALMQPYLWAFALFVWTYSGCETTTQGFLVDYLLEVRHAKPSTAGYVTSGYWAGQAISRFIWGHLIPSMTFARRKTVMHACLGVAFAMFLVIWLVPSVFGDCFAASIVGLVYGPMFPGGLGLAIDVLPSELALVSMAVLSWFASFGSALFPFMTGLLSNQFGSHVLAYVVVAQSASLCILWFLFPSNRPPPSMKPSA